MELAPYSIYYENRPLRIVFFLDLEGNQEWYDMAIKFSQDKWGGRLYPIIHSDGMAIEIGWLDFLEEYDPDILLFTMEPSSDLITNLETRISHFDWQLVNLNHPYIDDSPISIVPTLRNLSYIDNTRFFDERRLVLFEVNENTPSEIKLFLERNFGQLDTINNRTDIKTKHFETLNPIRFKIFDYEMLNKALTDLKKMTFKVIFPIQFCGYPSNFQNLENNPESFKFLIIVGDGNRDLMNFWNRSLILPNFTKRIIYQLWVPTKIFENISTAKCIIEFARYYDRVNNVNGFFDVQITSYTLQTVDLKAKSEKLKEVGKSFEVRSSDMNLLPKYRKELHYAPEERSQNLFTARSKGEHIFVEEPAIETVMKQAETWAVDMLIQYRSEKFANIHGVNYWWRLPRRNEILNGNRIFSSNARINKYGAFSVLLRRTAMVENLKVGIKITLPTEQGVFSALICGSSKQNKTCKTNHIESYDSIGISDKGQYFTGVFDLFPDLLNASHYVGDKYWRKMFEKMCNQNPDKDEKRHAEIQVKLKKDLKPGTEISEDTYPRLANIILKEAKGHVKKGVDLSFYDFLKETFKVSSLEKGRSAEEVQKQLRNFFDGGPKISEEYYKLQAEENGFSDFGFLFQDIDNLIEWNVFLIGLKPRCPRCGTSIFYHIDTISQKIKCLGCGFRFTISSGEKWHFRLNSLVRAAFSEHGTIPVILVLEELMDIARESFLYIPSINLFQKGADEKLRPAHELDICCIVDGEFVIGEVKQTIKGFGPNDFDDMKEIAEIIRPHRIIFSSIDPKCSESMRQRIEKLRADLSVLNIKVEWLQLPEWIFENIPIL